MPSPKVKNKEKYDKGAERNYDSTALSQGKVFDSEMDELIELETGEKSPESIDENADEGILVNEPVPEPEEVKGEEEEREEEPEQESEVEEATGADSTGGEEAEEGAEEGEPVPTEESEPSEEALRLQQLEAENRALQALVSGNVPGAIAAPQMPQPSMPGQPQEPQAVPQAQLQPQLQTPPVPVAQEITPDTLVTDEEFEKMLTDKNVLVEILNRNRELGRQQALMDLPPIVNQHLTMHNEISTFFMQEENHDLGTVPMREYVMRTAQVVEHTMPGASIPQVLAAAAVKAREALNLPQRQQKTPVPKKPVAVAAKKRPRFASGTTRRQSKPGGKQAQGSGMQRELDVFKDMPPS